MKDKVEDVNLPPILWVILSPLLLVAVILYAIFYFLRWFFIGSWKCQKCFKLKGVKDKKCQHRQRRDDMYTLVNICEDCHNKTQDAKRRVEEAVIRNQGK